MIAYLGAISTQRASDEHRSRRRDQSPDPLAVSSGPIRADVATVRHTAMCVVPRMAAW
jgi:hypothetical protein